MDRKTRSRDLDDVVFRLERLEKAIVSLRKAVSRQEDLIKHLATESVPATKAEVASEPARDLKPTIVEAKPGKAPEPLVDKVNRLMLEPRNVSGAGRLKRKIRRKVAREYDIPVGKVYKAEELVLQKMRIVEPKPKPKVEDYQKVHAPPSTAAERVPKPPEERITVAERRKPAKVVHDRYSREVAGSIRILQKEMRSPDIRESAIRWLMREPEPEESASRFINSYYSKLETPPTSVTEELLEKYCYPPETIELSVRDFVTHFRYEKLQNGLVHFPELCDLIIKRLKLVSKTARHRDLQSLTEDDVRQLVAREISKKLGKRGGLANPDSAALRQVVLHQLRILTTEADGRRPALKTREVDGVKRYFSWHHSFENVPAKSIEEMISEERDLRRGVMR